MKKKIYFLAFGIFILDQVIKRIITWNLAISEKLYVIPKFFYLTYVKNTGGAWSLLDSFPYLLALLSVVFLLFIFRYIYQKKYFSSFETIYIGMILGGVLGNLFDRLFTNGVIDYIGFQFGSYSYPIFNVADIMIVVGVFLVMIETLRGEKA